MAELIPLYPARGRMHAASSSSDSSQDRSGKILIAHACGRLESAQRQKGYWLEDANLRRELEAIIAEASTSGPQAMYDDGEGLRTSIAPLGA